MAGPLKTLFQMLQSSVYLQGNGVTLVFGDEEVATQRYKQPFVVMKPTGGPYAAPGYAKATDPNIENAWETAELIEFWLYNSSSDSANQGAVDHADAIETLRQWLLSAIQDQREQGADTASPSGGLFFIVVGGRWETFGNQVSKFSRAYVLTVRFPIVIQMLPPPELSNPKFPLTVTINP